MIIVGIDAHSRVHAAAAIDEHGRVRATLTVGARPSELDRLAEWIASLGSPRRVAVEGAKGFGLASRLTVEHLDADLKLLVDARDQLVAQATRVRNRLHALLVVLAPGYQDEIGSLANQRALTAAKRRVAQAGIFDPVRAKLALAAIARLRSRDREVQALTGDVTEAVAARRPTHLLALRGVGTIVAAKILGETRGVDRFTNAAAFAAHTGTAPIPASSGQTTRHRLNRGGNRQLNRALFTIALVQARCDPSARRYLERKRAEGKTASEARRCLKRHLANVVYKAMQADARANTSAAA